jgi:trimeric autotransporter adhesin
MKLLTIAAAAVLVGVQLLSAEPAKAQGPPSAAWSLMGDKGTAAGRNFIGTTDKQPFEIKVNGRRVMRFDPASARSAAGFSSPNLIGGDANNRVSRGVQGATIGGGGGFVEVTAFPNLVQGDWDTVGGGIGNTAGGGLGNTPGNAGASTVAGGQGNTASGNESTVGGGGNNTASFSGSTVAGGGSNTASGQFSTVAGGIANIASGQPSTIGGGSNNSASGLGTVAGGVGNIADGGSVGGGSGNSATGVSSTVGGGVQNTASGSESAVPGGFKNLASGETSFAAGTGAQAVHDSAFVWADLQNTPSFDLIPFSSANNNTFNVRATNGTFFVSGIDGSGNATAGVSLAPGGGSWGSISDRNLKENFAPVDARELLEQLARMPIRTWNYKAQAKSIRHVGPTAQDFRAAFKVGEDDRHITAVDADGVALAAIQGLYKMLQEKDAELRALRARQAVMAAQIEDVSVLKARLDSLERRADLTRVSYTARPALQPH